MATLNLNYQSLQQITIHSLDRETANEMYLFQTTPLLGHAPHSGSHELPVGGVAKQDQVQRGKRGASVTLDILTEQDGGALWTEKSGFLGDN